jgi:predicted histone-like DNA-binding protein
MPVFYDFYPTPNPNEGEETQYHPRTVTNGTCSTAELAARIQQGTTLNAAEVRAVLAILSQYFITAFTESRRVHLEGIGYFQLTLEGPPTTNPKQYRAENIHPKGVSFRPDRLLKQSIRELNFEIERVRTKRHSALRTEEEIDDILATYFTTHEFLTASTFCVLCGFTRTTAHRHLKRLLAAHKLQNVARASNPLYRPVTTVSEEQ